MLDELSANSFTMKNVDRDFTEWHKGRTKYAIWAIEINESSWLDNYNHARTLLKSYLFDQYERKPHITLFACGFYEEMLDDISKQSEALVSSKIKPFEIDMTEMSSFLSAPFFSIDDAAGGIQQIRNLFEGFAQEDRVTDYVPHLTIGLYNEEHRSEDVVQCIQQYNYIKPDPLHVKSISLMTYDTSSIFSSLVTEFKIELEH